jgi:hypothetical protein
MLFQNSQKMCEVGASKWQKIYFEGKDATLGETIRAILVRQSG